MNKKNFNIKFIVMIMVSTLSILAFSSFSNADKQDDFDVDVKVGYDGYYEYNKEFPILVELTNLSDDFNGKIQVLIPLQNGNKKLYTAYSKELRIAKGSSKTIDLQVNITDFSNKIIVRIINSKGKKTWEDEIKIVKGTSSDEISIGALTDDIESLKYFNLLEFSKLDGSNRKTNPTLVSLNNYIPENWRLLEMFDMIIINNYNTEKLNEDQIGAIRKWTENGGLLLIGTGPNYQKTLKGLRGVNFIEVKGTKNLGFGSVFNGLNDAVLYEKPLFIIDSILHDGNEILSKNDNTLIYNKTISAGNTVIICFDLGLSPFIDWNQKEEFLASVLEPYLTKAIGISGNIKSYSNNRYNNIVGYIPMSKAFSVKSIIVLIGLFILIIGPINYLVLKKLDKREKAWITIPAIVLIFSLVIYVWGFRTRFDKPLSNNISIIKIMPESDEASVETKSGIIDFKKGDMDISVDEKVFLKTISDNYNFYSSNFRDGDVFIEYVLDDSNHVIFKNRAVWDTQLINLEESINIDGNISSKLTLENGKITGEIENLSSLKLEDAVLIYNKYYEKLGDIDIGEKSSVNVSLNQPSFKNGYYDVINVLYPWNYSSNNNDKDDVLNSRVKREIAEIFLSSNYRDTAENNIFLIGWNRDQLTENVKVNDTIAERVDRNFILIPLQIGYEKGQKVEIPYDIFTPQVIEIYNMFYDWDNQSFNGEGYAVFAFKPDIDIYLTEMKIDITGGQSHQNYNISLYNYEANEWEKYEGSSFIIDDTNKGIYYDDNEGAKLKIEKNQRDYFQMPKFSVKGVVK